MRHISMILVASILASSSVSANLIMPLIGEILPVIPLLLILECLTVYALLRKLDMHASTLRIIGSVIIANLVSGAFGIFFPSPHYLTFWYKLFVIAIVYVGSTLIEWGVLIPFWYRRLTARNILRVSAVMNAVSYAPLTIWLLLL